MLMVVWGLGSIAYYQLRYVNPLGEGQVRRRKEIYSVDELGCDNCDLPATTTINSVGAMGSEDSMQDTLQEGSRRPLPPSSPDLHPPTRHRQP